MGTIHPPIHFNGRCAANKSRKSACYYMHRGFIIITTIYSTFNQALLTRSTFEFALFQNQVPLATPQLDPLPTPQLDPLATPQLDPLATPQLDPLATPQLDPPLGLPVRVPHGLTGRVGQRTAGVRVHVFSLLHGVY